MRPNWDRVRLRPDRGGRVRCETGWRLDRRWSESLTDYDLWLVWDGRGRMRIADAADGRSGGSGPRRSWLDLDLRPGVWLWMRPGRVYLAEQDPTQRLGVSYQHFQLLTRDDGSPILPGPGVRLPGEIGEARDVVYVRAAMGRVDELRRLQEARSTAAAGQLLRALLMDMEASAYSTSVPGEASAALSSDRRRAMEAVRRFAQWVREEPGRPWDVAACAADAGYSPDHFARLCRSVLGRSPKQWIVGCRIERAGQLLEESNHPIKRIASVLGYGDVYFFTRQFTACVGESPGRYRRRHGGR